MNIFPPDNRRRVQSPGWFARVEAAELRRRRPHRWGTTTLQAHSNIFEKTSKRDLMIFYPGFLGGDPSHQEWDARCQGLLLLVLWSLWFPLPFAGCLLQGGFPKHFPIWQSLKSDPPGIGHGRCSMRVPDRSSTHHWVPRHTILAWYLWQVPFKVTLWNTQIPIQIYKCNTNANTFIPCSFIHSFIHILLLFRFQAGKVLMLLAITSWVAFTLPIGFIHPPVVRYFSSGKLPVVIRYFSSGKPVTFLLVIRYFS